MNFILFRGDFIALIPEFYLIFALNFIIFFAVIYSTSPFFDYPLLIINNLWLSLQILFFVFFLSINNFYNAIIFNKLLIIDVFGKTMKCLTILIMIVFLFYLFYFSKIEGIFNFEFIIILLFTIVGFLFLISSYDLIGMYLSIELISFSSYILASFKRNSEFSTEAGLKYFILGAFSSNFLLFGCSLIYASLGTCNYENIFIILLNPLNFEFKYLSLFIGFFFILFSVLFKLSVVPFHFWSPDVYEGAFLIITTFFSVIPKISLFSLLVRLFFVSFYGSLFVLQNFIILVSVLSMFVGCFGAIWQIKIKRFLSFSAINNVGYMLLGFCCNSTQGIFSLFFYCFIYIIGLLSIFSILLLIYKNNNLKKLKYIKDFNIIFKQNYILGIYLSIIFFSMAGIPPLAGFLSKMFLFLNVIDNNLYILALFGVITSVISCFYYLRIMQISFFNKNYKWISFKRLDYYLSFFISLNIIFLITFFFNPTLLIILIYNSIIIL